MKPSKQINDMLWKELDKAQKDGGWSEALNDPTGIKKLLVLHTLNLKVLRDWLDKYFEIDSKRNLIIRKKTRKKHAK